jgi:carbonic anhydrase/acetyltransferase-like protein (isoleucine patch superfamily)
MAGAIVIAGSDPQVSERNVRTNTASGSWDCWRSGIASIPVLGCSPIARTVESMKRAGLPGVSILGTTVWDEKGGFVSSEEQAWLLAAHELKAFKEKGLSAVVITRMGHYIECEWQALIEEHCNRGQAVSRAFDHEGPLDLWVVDPNRFCADGDLLMSLRASKTAEYQVEGYVNRLTGARDLRRLVTDIFSSRCQVRPSATEVRPGLWVADGAQIARSARVVAPAYIGYGVKIADECLITRCSTVEANSCVDFGTAIEDSSVLPDTYVGIGLDLSHSLVDGGEILSLHHEVRLRISDPVVMRRHSPRVQHDPQLVLEMKEMVLSSTERH